MRNNFNKTIYLAILIAVMQLMAQSCASNLPRGHPFPCEAEFPDLFTAAPLEKGLSIVGKVRMELPRYRIRGICRVRYMSPGNCRIDFRHSSLFGAYREDASIFIRNGRMAIYDRERGNFFGNDSSLAILLSHVELEVYPEDILFALLFVSPECSRFTDLDLRDSGTQWRLKGRWRGRLVEILGERGKGPLSFRQCDGEGKGCYFTSYSYNETDERIRYPKRITFKKEIGAGRISFSTQEVSGEVFPEGVFEPGNFRERSID